MSLIQVEQITENKRENSLVYENSNNTIFLNHEEIVKLLPLFKEECVYMREAYLENGVLHCWFNTFDYPFSKKPTKHFTRTHALLFVTQASYLIGAVLREHNPRWPMEKETALVLASQEQMTFTNIELNFHKFIRNQNGIELILSIPRFRIIKNKLFADIEIDFPKGCYGRCRAIVALDGLMKIES